MNRKYRSIILALSSIFIAGCQTLETDTPFSKDAEFYATMESFDPQTKTYMTSDRQVVWGLKDEIGIFLGNDVPTQYVVSDATAGTTSGSFELVGVTYPDTKFPCNVAFYPCNAFIRLSSESGAYKITYYSLPATQKYTMGTFASGAFPMVAVTQDQNLSFKNLLGAIKLQLRGTGQIVTSIQITGKNDEILSGDVTVTAYPDNGVPSITMTGDDEAAKSVTLDCSEGVTIEQLEATEFIIALPSVTFSKGFTATVTYTDLDDQVKTYTIGTDKANTVLRSSILVMPALTLVEDLTLEKTSVTLPPDKSVTLVAKSGSTSLDGQILAWSSSNDAVAEVDQNGKVTAKSVGTATITVKAAGGINATCSVTVKTATAVANIDYVDEYGVNHGKGIVIGDMVWAPVNCGYQAPSGENKGYPYGKLYQWGRKYGQGYNGDDATTPTLTKITEGVAVGTGNDEGNKNVFYYGLADWLNPKDGTLWNSGTAESPVRTNYDPCPEGWRVPTKSELEKLKENCSSWTTDASGLTGYCFTGEFTYTEGVPHIFLPAAGYRASISGNPVDRVYHGPYWASTPGESGAYCLAFSLSDGVSIGNGNSNRAQGYSVRCVQN